jgi:hypothetical protein
MGDPMLGPLSDNGGPTQTMALLPGSPAIDAGTSCTATDQRGVTRPQGAACEIGAYEVPHQSVIYYVKWDANGANNGTSWINAYTDLQSALPLIDDRSGSAYSNRCGTDVCPSTSKVAANLWRLCWYGTSRADFETTSRS